MSLLEMLDFDWSVVAYHLITMMIAFVLALPIGWNRKRSSRHMGFRTFPLVSMASAGYILIGRVVIEQPGADAYARLLQGLMTGIGFLGGGAIVQQGANVEGTATAASVWNTAAIGAAVAFGRYEIAIVLAALNFIILLTLTPIADEIGSREDVANSDGEDEDN